MARDRASRPEAKPLRLFVAFEVPDEARVAATGSVAAIRERFPRARWVPPENLHVTLKFLGAVWPRLVSWVPERLEEVAAGLPPFAVRLGGLGAFRSARSARVVWVGLSDEPVGTMAGAAEAIDASLVVEFPAETRPFAAHLTLARSDPPLGLEAEDLAVVVPEISWTVSEIVLFQSQVRRPAPRYVPLERFRLGLQP